jgi:nitrous oxide reductase accessory protein NosL/NAD-dependent dihydropyrimidine dehydrogenase PreA subunit
MVDFIKRDKSDIFNKPVLGFIFKNSKFLMALRVTVTALFFYAIYFGFVNPTKENIFTSAVFWGVFWALFMVVTLASFGRIFCGICPHGFLGKYITKAGLKKTMPKWMQNRYIGIVLLVIGWWGIYYTFPGFWKSPFNTAAMFTGLTLLAFVIYYIYKDMSYCKFICPIGTLTRAYDKLSFTKLETYTDSCKECKTFECANACQYNLKPFTFAKKNQTDDCTLCMDCANSCEAVKFKFTKPAQQLSSKLKLLNAEIWTYILILASIPISMGFAHGLERTKIADQMIWNTTAKALDMEQYAGGFAFAFAILFTVIFSISGLYLASKVLKKDYNTIFTTLGIAFIPLFIFASLGHTLEMFFIKDYAKIVEGFAQGFGIIADVDDLAKRGDSWLYIFKVFKWIGVLWAFIILYQRMKLIYATKFRKTIGYFFASFAILFYIALQVYTGYVFKTYGSKARGGHSHHGMHGGDKMFQSVPFNKATLLQSGKDKTSCPTCGMKLPMFFKTNHAAIHQQINQMQFCSIHCLVDEIKNNKKNLTNIKVVDTNSLKFIDAQKAFYVVGSSKKGTMSMVSKYAFTSKDEAIGFAKKYGGEIMSFEDALQVASKELTIN